MAERVSILESMNETQNTMKKITIDDLLEVGTKVQFQGKRGVIKTAKWVKDQWVIESAYMKFKFNSMVD